MSNYGKLRKLLCKSIRMLSPAAKNLKLIRTQLFLTQEAFGRYFNLTRHKVNSYEMGRAKVPASLISQLCSIFNLSISAFIADDLAKEEHNLSNVTPQSLEQEREPVATTQVNEWREKYYTVLEKYNEVLEELRRYKKASD